MMSLINEYEANGGATREEYKILLQLLNPFAPHITEEAWQQIGMSEEFGILSMASIRPSKMCGQHHLKLLCR